MLTVVVVGPDNTIRGYLGNSDDPTRAVHLQAEKARLTAEHESAQGADDVTFVEVTDVDDAAFRMREINTPFEWDPIKQVGIPDEATLDARARAVADTEATADARAAVDTLADIASGDPSQSVRVLARAVRFLVLRELRE